MVTFAKVAITLLKSLNITEGVASIKNSDAKVIYLLWQEKMVSEQELLSAVRESILSAGHESYKHHIGPRTYTVWPDHTLCPYSFAYALYHRTFTEEEEGKIKYDGQTRDGFVEEYYRSDFPERLLKQVLTPSNVMQKEVGGDPHPVCTDH